MESKKERAIKKDLTTVVILPGMVALLFPTLAFACSPLGRLQDTLVAAAGSISLFGVVTMGMMLVFGGKGVTTLNRRAVYVVLAICIAVGASCFLVAMRHDEAAIGIPTLCL